MKKNQKIIFTLALAFSLTGNAGAQEAVNLPKPGITPDSPFYFIDKVGDDISIFFSFSDEAKIKKQLEISQERLAEAQQMQVEGNVNAVAEAVGEYNKNVKEAALNVAEAAKTGENFSEALNNLLTTTNSVSQIVLSKVYLQVPEQAKSAIQSAMRAAEGDMNGAIKAAQENQIKRSQNIMNENLNKAKENAPEAAKKYIPDNINVNDYVKPEDVNVNSDTKWQEDLKKDMEKVNNDVKSATDSANVDSVVRGVQNDASNLKVPDVKVPNVTVPSVNIER